MEEKLNNRKTEIASAVGHELQVIQLLREFFDNRRKLKTIKNERSKYRASNNCKNFIHGEGDCIDRRELNMCEVCKKRDELHKEILRISYRNNGILTSLRAKVG